MLYINIMHNLSEMNPSQYITIIPLITKFKSQSVDLNGSTLTTYDLFKPKDTGMDGIIGTLTGTLTINRTKAATKSAVALGVSNGNLIRSASNNSKLYYLDHWKCGVYEPCPTVTLSGDTFTDADNSIDVKGNPIMVTVNTGAVLNDPILANKKWRIKAPVELGFGKTQSMIELSYM